MRTAPNLIAITAVVLAGLLALAGAVAAANLVERRAKVDIRSALAGDGITWVQVAPDGLLVKLTGTAPNEAKRFHALAIAGRVVDAARVIDNMEVTPTTPMEAPHFALELLRNQDGVTMIGLVPAGMQREAVVSTVQAAADGALVTDMLNSADYPEPEHWAEALSFGLEALAMLPRSKISIAADGVAVTAISGSIAQKRKLEAELARRIPKGVNVTLAISAPRPVITPFILRFLIDADGARFDACTADTSEAAARILGAARAAGMPGEGRCMIGLGVPSPNWSKAVQAGIGALAELGGGSLTLSDADVTLVALDSTPQESFDRVTGALEAALPAVFSLHAVLPEPVKVDGTGDNADGPPEFVATKSPEGLVQLRGVVTNELTRAATISYAHARFGENNVHGRMRLDGELPDGWPLRVLTALEGLAKLTRGSVVVQPSFVDLQGETEDDAANVHIAQLFSSKLGGAQHYRIAVSYTAPPDPKEAMPTAMQCAESINLILEAQKISFEPGSANVDGASRKVINGIAQVLEECPDVEMEIAGYTDSQGRAEMNLQLSQQRADAVLNALIARRVLTTHIAAKGYGEADPIADNGTDAGREENRRIEFRLILPGADAGTESAAKTAVKDAVDAGAADAEATTTTTTTATGTDTTDGQD